VWIGAAGSVVLLLLWVYYASCILLFGAEFTRAYAKEIGHEIRPAPGAVPVTAEQKAQQGLAPAVPAVLGKAPAIPRTKLFPVEAPPKGPNPFGALLAVTGATFLLGLVARGITDRVR